MRLLVDSHTLLWWFSGGSQLSGGAYDAMADPENDLLLSAVVIWEISRSGSWRWSGASGTSPQT
ncbi:type II toxin-antitoxin system VapC family toxin [Patulibacter sp. S7RM1-6]